MRPPEVKNLLLVLAASLAVVAVLAGASLLRSDPAADGGPPAAGTPTEWRTEYWHDTQVDVPADWGWGSSPSADGRGVYWCGEPGAVVGPAGTRLPRVDPTVPYVGRPILQTDVCQGGGDQTPPAPYVWLGAPVEPGTVDLGDGYVRETREVNGSTVSVATRDAALRERILDSATGGASCSSDLEEAPSVRSILTEGMGAATSMQVCAYRGEPARGFDLVYAARLGAAAAQRFVSAATAARAGTVRCADAGAGELVVLTVEGDDPFGDAPVTQDYVVDLGCPAVEVSPGDRRELTRAVVEPWAVGGIQAVLVGPRGGRDPMTDLFIGMQG